MIIVPELETVVILTPRTGSQALRNALLETYPKAIMLYRHMEADGVPAGYDRWHRVGVVRHPLDRLWSLYRYLKVIGDGRKPDGKGKWEPEYVRVQRESAQMPFSDWLCDNRLPFTTPYNQEGDGFFPAFTVKHPVPENRKSQFIYLRPDLGTRIVPFGELPELFASLGINPDRINAAPDGVRPHLTSAAASHLRRFFKWDYSFYNDAPIATADADPA